MSYDLLTDFNKMFFTIARFKDYLQFMVNALCVCASVYLSSYLSKYPIFKKAAYELNFENLQRITYKWYFFTNIFSVLKVYFHKSTLWIYKIILNFISLYTFKYIYLVMK